MKKKLLISDIAKQLDVSITTVSFILNGKAKEKRISDTLAEKVLKLVEEVNYKPNQLAQSLRTGKTKTIGLIVEDISNPFFANIARLIEERAYREGYRIIYCSTEDNTAKARELIHMFRDKHVDGYIITPPEGVNEDISELISEGLPVVLIDRQIAGLDVNLVAVDNLTGAYTAASHLIGQGYRKIAFITTDSRQNQMLQRLEGYQQALNKFGLAPTILEIPYSDEADQMTNRIRDFLRKKKEVEAIFFSTNYLAIRGLEAMGDLDLAIPTDLGIVSYDDLDVFRLYRPSITAVAQPTADIANHAINVMMGLLKDKPASSPANAVILPTRLIVRHSSVRP